jgi:hypothetical protein
MKANPAAAKAALASGFADSIGVPADKVVVTGTEPSLDAPEPASRRLATGRRLSDTEFTVMYEVTLNSPAAAAKVGTAVTSLATNPPAALTDSLVSNLQSALADMGITVEVTAVSVALPVVQTNAPTPAPTAAPTAEAVAAEGGMSGGVIAIIVIVVLGILGGGGYVMTKKQPQQQQVNQPLTEEPPPQPAAVAPMGVVAPAEGAYGVPAEEDEGSALTFSLRAPESTLRRSSTTLHTV